MASDLISVLRSSLTRLGLRGSRLVVAVSGGPDSVALALGLFAIQGDLGLSLQLGHFDHRLRPESTDDAQFVRHLAGQLDLPFILGSADVRSIARERGLGLEEASRNARYRFLGDAIQENGATAVVLGHTADDQTETRLLHLARGCGIRGLVGMTEDALVSVPDAAPLRAIRPLLNVPRSATAAYCSEHGILPRHDASNDDLTFARNRLRARVVPELRAINSGVDQALEHLARQAADLEEYIGSELDQRIATCRVVVERGWRIDRRVWRDLPTVLKRELLRRAAVAVAGGQYEGLGAEAVERGVEAADCWPAGRTLTWPSRLRLRVEHDWLDVTNGAGRDAEPVSARTIPLVGVLSLGSLPDALAFASREPAAAAEMVLESRRVGTACSVTSRWHADLDLDRIGDAPIFLRGRARGDWLAPQGMSGRKKLQDLLVDAHIPRIERSRVAIVAVGADVAWVLGLRRDRRFLADTRSRDVLCLVARPGLDGEDDKEGPGDRTDESARR